MFASNTRGHAALLHPLEHTTDSISRDALLVGLSLLLFPLGTLMCISYVSSVVIPSFHFSPDIRTIEVLCRSYDVREETMRVIKPCPPRPSPPPHSDADPHSTTATVPVCAEPTSTAADDATAAAGGAAAAAAAATGAYAGTPPAATPHQAGGGSSFDEPADDRDAGNGDGAAERSRVAGAGGAGEGKSERLTPPTKRTRKDMGGRRQVLSGNSQGGDDVMTCVAARPWPETKGHTGYLTFARKTV